MAAKPRCQWCKQLLRGQAAGNLCAECRTLCDAGVSKKAVKRFFRNKRDGANESKRQVGIIQAGGQRRVGDSQAVYRKRRGFKKRG
jgi:hypothetical protein